MNPVTLTDDVVRAIDIAFPDVHRDLVPKMQAATRKVPLLTYDYGRDDYNKKLDEIAAVGFDGIFPTPFESFRFFINVHDEKGGVWYGIAERMEEQLRVVAVAHDADNRKIILKVYLNRASTPLTMDWNSRAFRHDTGVEITKGPYGSELLTPHLQKNLDIAVTMMIGTLCAVCSEYLASSNHVATVVPDKPGKSVEWKQAREHYTIIHRTHAANSAEVSMGSVVDQDLSKHLKRIAHSRRAHTRLLRSERYKSARGKIINVRSTWVGPPEWKDTVGQIYRIVDRTKLGARQLLKPT